MGLLICTRKLPDMSFKIVAITCANPVQCQSDLQGTSGIYRDIPSAPQVSVMSICCFVPFSVISQECICDCYKLSHDGCDDNFEWFSCGHHGLIFCLEDRIKPRGNECRHVQSFSHICTTTLNKAFALLISRLPGNRRKTRECSSLTFIHAAKFRHFCKQGMDGNITKARNGFKDCKAAL